MYSVHNSLRTSEFYRDGYGGFKPRPGDIRDICSECGRYRSLGHAPGCVYGSDEKEDADEKREGDE